MITWPGCLSVCQSVGLSVCPPVRLSVRLSVCPSVRLSVCPSVCLSVCPPVRLSVCLSVCLLLGFTRLHCTYATERIEVLFGVEILGNSRNITRWSLSFQRIRYSLRQITLALATCSLCRWWTHSDCLSTQAAL